MPKWLEPGIASSPICVGGCDAVTCASVARGAATRCCGDTKTVGFCSIKVAAAPNRGSLGGVGVASRNCRSSSSNCAIRDTAARWTSMVRCSAAWAWDARTSNSLWWYSASRCASRTFCWHASSCCRATSWVALMACRACSCTAASRRSASACEAFTNVCARCWSSACWRRAACCASPTNC